MTIAPNTSNFSVVKPSKTGSLQYEHDSSFTDLQDIYSATTGGPEHNIVYDTDPALCSKLSSQKRKDSVTSLVDNIFSDINGSFFLEPQRKKRRTNFSVASSPSHHSLNRCGKSFASLHDRIVTEEAPNVDERNINAANGVPHSISDPAMSVSAENSAINILDNIFFPNLPATVSNSSCASKSTVSNRGEHEKRSTVDTHTFNLVHGSVTSTHYGWFVQIDEAENKRRDQVKAVLKNNKRSTEIDELAFKAPTAPKRVDDEAELEWASAADTVDNVLADLF